MGSRVVCITGMHRSGTSLAASWLQQSGLVIDVGGLVGPQAGNRLGHFEDVEMMLLHRREFLAHRRRSRGWRLQDAEFLGFTGERAAQAQRIIAERGSRYGQWGWKDPRSIAFLPEWHRLAPSLVSVIFWRPAGLVVTSLLRRAQSSTNRDMRVGPRNALRSWVAYNELALKYRAAHPASSVLVPVETLLEDDARVFGLLTDRLGIDLRYTRLSDVFSRDLMEQRRQSLPDLRRLGSLIGVARGLEERLVAISDV